MSPIILLHASSVLPHDVHRGQLPVYYDMFSQLSLAFKFLATNFTVKWPLLGMHKSMIVKMRYLLEALAALTTGVRSLFAVSEHVGT